MLTSYRFEHPATEQSIMLEGWSYLWAGLFGAFYVRWIGLSTRFIPALAVTMCFVFIGAAVVIGASYLPWLLQVAILLIALPGLVIGQSFIMTSLIRKAFRRRGWLVRIGR
jgi:hypothetical protein